LSTDTRNLFGAKSPTKAIHPALEKQNRTKKQLAETGISK